MTNRNLPATEDRGLLLTASLCLLLSAIILLPTLTYPINIDTSVHLYMAALVRDGHWPYVETWENNWPGTIFLVHLPQLFLVGKSAFAVHLWDLLWQVAISAVIFFGIARIANRRAAFMAAVLPILYYASIDSLYTAQRDNYATLFILGAIFMLLRRSDRVVIPALLLGAAILIRPTNGLIVGFVSVWLFFNHVGRAGILSPVSSGRVTRLITFLAFSGVPVALFLGLYGVNGWFDRFYETAVLFNAKVYGNPLPLSELLYPLPRYWLIGLFGIWGTWKMYRTSRRSTILLAGVMLMVLLSLVPQHRYQYQYHTFFAILFLFGGVGVEDIVQRLCAWMKPNLAQGMEKIGLGIALLLLLLMVTRGTALKRVVLGIADGTLRIDNRLQYTYDDSPMSGYHVLDSVGDYLRAHTSPNDRLQVLGEYAYPLLRAERMPASRFITLHSLMLRGQGDTLKQFQLEWRDEYLRAMKEHSPTYFVVPDAPEYARGHLHGLLGHEILERDMIELGGFVKSAYHLETKIGAFSIYRLNSDRAQ